MESNNKICALNKIMQQVSLRLLSFKPVLLVNTDAFAACFLPAHKVGVKKILKQNRIIKIHCNIFRSDFIISMEMSEKAMEMFEHEHQPHFCGI